MKVPSQYTQLMPYIIIPNAYKFIEFMKNVFGATEQAIVPRSEGVVMHGELRVGGAVIMFADVTDQFESKPAGMFIYVENTDETYKKALAAGAVTVEGQEPSDKDYGRTCGVKDPFGNTWWITSVR